MIALGLACLWAVAANVAAMLPSGRNHWPAAAFLAATGAPLVVYGTLVNGPLFGLALLAAGVSVLRYPIYLGARHILRRISFVRGRP